MPQGFSRGSDNMKSQALGQKATPLRFCHITGRHGSWSSSTPTSFLMETCPRVFRMPQGKLWSVARNTYPILLLRRGAVFSAQVSSISFLGPLVPCDQLSTEFSAVLVSVPLGNVGITCQSTAPLRADGSPDTSTVQSPRLPSRVFVCFTLGRQPLWGKQLCCFVNPNNFFILSL